MYKTMTEAVKDRVKRGRKMLNRKCPGWKKKIDINLFDIKSTYECIIGQLRKHNIIFALNYRFGDAAVEYGFDAWCRKDALVNNYDKGIYYILLQREWIRVLNCKNQNFN